MDRRYEAFCVVDPYFYDATSQAGAQPTDFDPVHAPAPPGWVATDLDDWRVHRPVDLTLPQQGWKIHVSACLDNAAEVLTTVADYCHARRIAFKFLRSLDVLMLANLKYAHRGSSGKFVTIYPVDEPQLETVLRELDALLAGSPGPYVLSDLRWGKGPLYVRYGGFAERWCLSESGTWELAIADGSGQLVPDRRSPSFQVPPWVRLPAFLEPHLTARNSVTVEGLPYQFSRPLHFSNGGGLYEGRHIATGDHVVLREARPHAGLDADRTDAVAPP
jgi:hypothetical protein